MSSDRLEASPVAGWDDTISPEREEWLKTQIQLWAQSAASVTTLATGGPFKGQKLTGADLHWLVTYTSATQVGQEHSGEEMHTGLHRDNNPLDTVSVTAAAIPSLAGADLRHAQLAGADLSGVHLEETNLSEAILTNAALVGTHFEGANLIRAQLTGVDMTGALLQGAVLIESDLEGSNLYEAHLEHASLRGVNLRHASLFRTRLNGANLTEANLEGAGLYETCLVRANLHGATLDEKTLFIDARLAHNRRVVNLVIPWRLWSMRNTSAELGDIHWPGVGNVNLANIDWRSVTRLGDERGVRFWTGARHYTLAARTYRQVAAQLRAQGLSEEADRFTYRALIVQRKALIRQNSLGSYLFSWCLAILAGYGYRPMRTILWYLFVIFGFAWSYYEVSHGVSVWRLQLAAEASPLQPLDALVLSVSSFHGRGFFQPSQNPGDPIAVLAAIEAILGLLIEASFIATFTHRYFGSR